MENNEIPPQTATIPLLQKAWVFNSLTKLLRFRLHLGAPKHSYRRKLMQTRNKMVVEEEEHSAMPGITVTCCYPESPCGPNTLCIFNLVQKI